MPPDEEGLSAGGGRLRSRLRAFLLAALAAQALTLAFQHAVFFEQLFRFPSRWGLAGSVPAGSSALLAAEALLASWLWARRGSAGCLSARLGTAGLANLAAAGLVAYGTGLATGRFVAVTGAATLAVSGAAALLVPRRGARVPSPLLSPPLSWGDALSGAALLTLVVPAFFPFIHFDAVTIWGCRSLGFAEKGFFGALAACIHPEYPPLFSALLGFGAADPLLQGRLLAWLLVVFFALFVRERFERALPGAGPLALAFLLCTVHVWQGAAMYYSNVALMAFLSAGLLLVLGLPLSEEAPSGATTGDLVAGTLCLSAALLVRPDGVYYLAAAVAALLLARRRGGPRVPLLPLVSALAIWASWSLRPPLLKGPGLLSQPSDGWRSLAPEPLAAAAAVLKEFALDWQGQWLSHKGLGAAIYALVAAAVVDLLLRSRERATQERASAEKRLYGLVTLAALAAVVFCFGIFPFVTDPVAAVQPFETTDYAACYRNFLRVGFGRMTIHLIPFFVLYVLAVLRPPSPGAAANIGRN